MSGDLPYRSFIAPARINIIGEHVDYLGGIVLPAAIDFQIRVQIAPTTKQSYEFESLDFQKVVSVPTAEHPLQSRPNEPWCDYPLGVVMELRKLDFVIPGFSMRIQGNIPQGSGLSSSAALEVAVAYALNETFGFGLDRTSLALLSQRAENLFVGTQCGIMDQFVICHGKKNHCLALNTETLSFSYHQFDLQDREFYLINSGVKHSLKDSAYNTRRTECEQALHKIQSRFPLVPNLYSANLEQAESLNLSPAEEMRLRHVLSEKERTQRVISGMNSGNWDQVGRALFECHKSLSSLFEVSCQETDFLVQSLADAGVLGARMIGGGFGGCILVLDYQSNFEQTQAKIRKLYSQKFSTNLEFYRFQISDGVQEVANQ